MSNALVVGAISPAEVKAQIQLIQQVMRDCMIEGVHYGVVPGAPKPSLWKAGAEVLCTLFHIAPSYRFEVERADDSVSFAVTCIGTHQATGIVLGEGIAECSTDESKYKWREPVCPEEAESMPADRVRTKWRRDGKAYFQVRTEVADQINTVKKMRAKRALVAMVLNVRAASDIFSQDLEDLDDTDSARATERRRGKNYPPRPSEHGKPGIATTKQQAFLRNKLDAAGMSAETLCKQFGVESLAQFPFNQVNAALAFIADPERAAIQSEQPEE